MADQKSTTSDGAIGWLILSGVIFVILLLIWHFFEYQIKSAFRWLRWSEMWLVSLFTDENYIVHWNGQDVPFEAAMEQFANMNSTDIDGFYFAAIAAIPMEPLLWPFIAGIGLMGMWAYMYGPGTQYRRQFNLDGLIGAQSKTFPAIAPFVKFNPSTLPPRPPGSPVPAELPLFAEALGPEEWLAYSQVPIPDGRVDEGAAYLAFSRQLGGRWRGALNLPPYKQILLAAFCLKAARKRRESDDMMGRVARCWAPGKGLNLSRDRNLLKEARAVLKNKDISASTLAKCNQHAFQTTALLRALQTAREEGGVLAPAQFVWLRGFDRVLWYPLNNLGRQAFHMEALGAISHYKAERLTQRPIPKPKVDNAVISITDYMNSPRARPVPQLDYSQSSKRGIKKPKQGVKKPKPKSKA